MFNAKKFSKQQVRPHGREDFCRNKKQTKDDKAETVFQNKGDAPIYRDGKANVLMIIPGPWGAEDRHRMHPELVKEYMTVAKRYGVDYLCAGDFAKASEEDGVHYLPEEHGKLGRAVAAKVLEIFEE